MNKKKSREKRCAMKYILMHKNIETALIDIDDVLGGISVIEDIYSEKHLPVGVITSKGSNEKAVRSSLNKWWRGRCIPASRTGINEALETIGADDTSLLLTRCLGLSLSDHYWIRPADSDLKWENINFFENDFSDDMGDVLFGKKISPSDIEFLSPDNTSDGDLKKRWKIIDGKRCLIKGGSYPYRQQPYNEVIASLIAEKLGIAHVHYDMITIADEPLSICEDFVTTHTELVSAYRIMQIRERKNHESEYMHYVNICRELGVDVVPALDGMITLDYIIANEDRHFGNFGLLRDPDTLEWIGAAPVFDSGTSLWYNRSDDQITTANIICKPFRKTHSEQAKLISDISKQDLSALDGIEADISRILSSQKPERTALIAKCVMNRTETLKKR